MRKLLLAVLVFVVPMSALAAGHGDVIEVQLKEGCTLQTYVAIKNDFNAQWGKKNSYLAEVFVPVQSDDLSSIYWVGRTANAEAFGKAWNQWTKDLEDPNSAASKLWARFQACSTNVRRVGYDVH